MQGDNLTFRWGNTVKVGDAMSIKIRSYIPSNSEGRIVGYVSFEMSKTKMFFNDCPVIRRKDGGFFVASPSRKYQDNEGKDIYRPYWGFYDKDYSQHFQSLVMAEIEKKWEEMNQQQPQPEENNGELPF